MNYWESIAKSRASRRRVLAGITMGAGAVVASTLVGCTSSDSENGSAADLVYKPSDTTSKAKSGGVLPSYIATVPDSFDSATIPTARIQIGYYTYPRLIRRQSFVYPKTPSLQYEGDFATSYEMSGDKLQITFKLRQGLKWDSRAPTNGREIVASDVVKSWERFETLSSTRSTLSYKANPQAPIESVTAVGKDTVVVKLAQPDPDALALISAGGGLFVMPAEADDGFNPKTDVRGYGPYLLDTYEPAVRMVWRKNPEYHLKDLPLIDRIERPIVPEYAVLLAQFRAGAVYAATDVIGGTLVRQDDILSTKNDLPQLLLSQAEDYPDANGSYLRFGYEGIGTPFRDLRVRQALSLLIDREAYLDVLTNSSRFESAGLTTSPRVQMTVPAGYEGFWLDPTDEAKFGPKAKYLKPDVEEAKKLLSAASYPAAQVPLIFSTFPGYPEAYKQLAQIIPEQLIAGGMPIQIKPVDHTPIFSPDLVTSYAYGNTKGFEGIALTRQSGAGAPTASLYAYEHSHPNGRVFAGMPGEGRRPEQGDSEITSLLEKARTEFDLSRQQEYMQEYQRVMAERAYIVPLEISTLPFDLSWPALQNRGTYRSVIGGNPVVESYLNMWIDDTKAPITR